MKNFEFKSQVATSVEQSKRLLELGLKKETADMHITNMSSKGINYTDDWGIGTTPYCDAISFWESIGLQLEKTAWSIIPAWSLHRLLEMLYANIGECMIFFPNTYDEFIADIENHIRRGCFNQDYLEER